MAEKGEQGSAKPSATAAERQPLRSSQGFSYWQRNAAQLRRRNLLTGLAIGTFVVGVFSYTILSVQQEKVMEQLDDEARIHIFRGPRTGANS